MSGVYLSITIRVKRWISLCGYCIDNQVIYSILVIEIFGVVIINSKFIVFVRK